jgi:4-oxalocrotonate tautomerase
MPHVIVKLRPGESDAEKRDLSDAIVGTVTRVLNYDEEAVPVGFEEVAPSESAARVYEPDVREKWGTLLKRPASKPAD